MIEWINDLGGLCHDDACCVVVTVAGVRGSAPREIVRQWQPRITLGGLGALIYVKRAPGSTFGGGGMTV